MFVNGDAAVKPQNLQVAKGSVLRTASGVFYSGMTLHDAKMIGRDKCFLRRDFKKLDKNCDNVLTNDEIMLERDREVKRFKGDGIFIGLFALDEYVRLFKSSGGKIFNIIFAGIFTLGSINAFSKAKKLKESNEYIRKNFNV